MPNVMNNQSVSQNSDLPEVELTVGAVAARLGIAPGTLRTWGHRYGLVPGGHVSGRHRKYTAKDVARLDAMKKMILSGVSVADAARIVKQQEFEAASIIPSLTPVNQAKKPQLTVVQDDEPRLGDNVISLDGAKSSVKSLSRAAMMLDGEACESIIASLIAAHGIQWTWDNVIVPVLISFGDRWEDTGEGVEVEHLVSEAITAQFKRYTSDQRELTNARPVVLACAPNEMHSLPIYAMAAGLAEYKIYSCVLGPRMPAEALALAAYRLNACAVVVWSHSIGTADVRLWDSMRETKSPMLKMSAGPGWVDDVPDNVVTARDFSDALMKLSRAAGTSA